MRIELTAPGRFTDLLRHRYNLVDIPRITGITIDSRQARAGDLFISIVGNQCDGHDFAHLAIKSGAVAVMAERDIPGLPSKAIVIPTTNTIRELGDLAQVWRDMYSPRTIGITGSNGKTTTKNLSVSVLKKRYSVLGTEHSYNSTIGLPLTLLRLGQKSEVLVLEMGSNCPGEIAYLARLSRPDVGLITNISETHVANLSNKEGVIREKQALFEALSPDGTAIVNVDDDAVARMGTRAWRFTYGLNHHADVSGCVEKTATGDELVVDTNLRIRLQQPGVHLARNVLAAVAVGLHFKVPPKMIKEAIEGSVLPSGRGELIQYNGVIFINDSYNANLASTLAGLEAMLQLTTEGRRIVVLGDMLELGRFSEEHHRLIGEYAAAQAIDEFFCYGPETRITYCTAISSGLKAHHFDDKSELSRTLAQSLATGDMVYVKGSRGMAMETVIEDIIQR